MTVVSPEPTPSNRILQKCSVGRVRILSYCLLMIVTVASHAQEVVPVGSGSYASTPPPFAGKGAEDMLRFRFPLAGDNNRAIPTNQIWTNLLKGKPEGSLWMYPWRVDPRETGLELFLPLRWADKGNDPVAEFPLKVEGHNFNATNLKVKDWGDWTLSFRLAGHDDRHLDVTVGEGMPIVWIEPQGVDLVLKGTEDARAIGADGKPLTFPARTQSFLISMAGRNFGVFLPPNSTVSRDGASLRITTVGKSFAAIAALSNPDDLKIAAKSAYAIPRDSKLTWAFDAEKGKVHTTWTVRTEPLVANQADVVWQGWLAHHWRSTEHQLELTGPQYLSPRGVLKTSIGNNFELTYDFVGVLPTLPAPKPVGGEHPYSSVRMEELLNRRVQQPKYGDDSYWGGKDLLHFAQYLQFATELNSPTKKSLAALSRKSLADWLTYTPGETAHYFARYDNWRAMIGFQDSYDSARFNDQHFHFGYFTYAAALLAMDDATFLDDYGPMLRLVAKQYANWDRDDDRFPFLRTFDPWAGHSWAGGLGAAGGNNQESTSEAVQSWIGLFLLGTMLDDPEMTAAGAMGYAMESQATMEYWFNESGDILPKEYANPVVGVLWSGGNVFGTYFSGDPAWVYAIQCLPQSPGLDYLARKPEWALMLYRQILSLRIAKEGSDDLAVMGDLGNCLLAQLSLLDPDAAAEEFERLWDADNDIAKQSLDAARTYYQTHAYRQLGGRAWDIKLSVPTSAVYHHLKTSVTTYAVYNPHDYPVIVRAEREGKSIGTFVAGPRQLTSTTSLDSGTSTGLAGTLPVDGDNAVSRTTETLYAVFHAPVTAVPQVKLSGKGNPILTCDLLDGGRVLRCRIAAPLTPGETYRWQLTEGKELTFTLEPQPPLALLSSDPTEGQERVALDSAFLLTFNAPITAASAKLIRLEGKSAPTLSSASIGRGDVWRFAPKANLAADKSYSLIIPDSVATIFGDRLGAQQQLKFVTAPLPCPPNIYTESFAGLGHWKSELTIDWGNGESPHTGQRALKLTTLDKNGDLALFNGPGNQSDDRRSLDLSGYEQVEFWLKGTCDAVYIKIGHPVFDNKCFAQTHLKEITREYQRFTFDLPEKRDDVNTVFEISVPKESTVWLDDIRFIGNASATSASESRK